MRQPPKLWMLPSVLLAFMSFAGAHSTSQTAAPFTLTISSPSVHIAAGDPVKITVTLSNDSNLEVRTPPLVSRPDLGETLYDVRVRFPNGEIVPGTAYDIWRERSHLLGTYGLAAVSPGGTLKSAITVSKLFDMTAPGEYLVRVCADWHGATKSTRTPPPQLYPVVCSSELRVLVTI